MASLRSLLRALRLSVPRGSPAVFIVSGAAGAGLALACYGAYRDVGVQHWGERHYRDIVQGSSWPRRGILLPVSAAKETNPAERPDLEDLDMFASSREQRFRVFASLEYEGQLYMTPRDFLESVTTDEPRNSKKWKSLSRQDLNNLLLDTPPVWKGSSKFFRTLGDKDWQCCYPKGAQLLLHPEWRHPKTGSVLLAVLPGANKGKRQQMQLPHLDISMG